MRAFNYKILIQSNKNINKNINKKENKNIKQNLTLTIIKSK